MLVSNNEPSLNFSIKILLSFLIPQKILIEKNLIIGEVEIYVSPAIVNHGDNLRLISITKFKERPLDISTSWSRSAFDDTLNDTKIGLVSLDISVIANELKSRYRVFKSENMTEKKEYIRNVTLSITNATAFDSSKYEICHTIDGKHFCANHSVIVSEALTAFWNGTKSVNYTVRTEHENSKVNLDCTIRHTNNHSVYDLSGVFISTTKEAKKVNISRQFSKTLIPRYTTKKDLSVEDAAIVKKDSIATQLYDIKYTNESFKFDYTHNGQFLHCRGINKKNSQESVDAVVELNITHSPRFSCRDVQQAYLYDKNKKISCRIYSNPIETKNIYWEFSYGGRNTKLLLDQSKGEGDYKIKSYNKKISPKYIEVELQFSKVQSNYFKSYKLYAKNKYGSRTKKISFKASKEIDQFSFSNFEYIRIL